MLTIALLAASGGVPPAAPAQTPARTIRVVMVSYAFDPNLIRLTQGERVVLQLSNEDLLERNHNFAAGLFAEIPIVVRGDVYLEGVSSGRRFVAVEPGRQVEVEFTAPQPGTYPFICSILGHAERGQTGTIVVQAR